MSLRVLMLSIGLLSLFIDGKGLAADVGSYDKHVKTFLNAYCVRCHGPKLAESDLRVDKLSPELALGNDIELWHEVVNKALLGEMPPKGETPSPGRKEIDAFAEWIHAGLLTGEKALASSGGKVVIRRMNRSEYLHTIQDLFGFHNSPILPGMLPADASAFGFDTIGSAKTLDPGSLQLYIEAASKILEQAGVVPSKNKPATQRLFKDREYLLAELESIVARSNSGRAERAKRKAKKDGVKWIAPKPLTIYNNNSHRAIAPADSGYDKTAIHVRRIVVARGMNGSGGGYRARQYYTQSTRKELVNIRYGGPGLYRVRVRAAAKIHDPNHLPVLRIAMAGEAGEQELLLHTVSSEMRSYEGQLYIGTQPKERERVVYLTCRGDSGIEADSASNAAEQDLIYFDSIEIEGPLNTEWPPRPYQTVFPEGEDDVNDRTRVAAYLREFASKAWRRPVKATELDFAMSVFDQTVAEKFSPREAVLNAYQVILSSPQFLFITEERPGPRPLNDYELASRLSYFLWSSMPDQELMRLATAGRLNQPAILKAQAQRMMADPKRSRFAKDFSGQWLQVREVGAMAPARAVFPDYNGALELAMRQETELFFEEVVSKNLSILNFIDSDWTFLNTRLARHYGIKGVQHSELKRVNLNPRDHRGGVLTHGGILQLTSDAVRTKPITRAAFILTAILGTPPPPPPANLGEIADIPVAQRSLRERFELHRKNPACAICHQKLDPVGFVLENYDGIGKWRETEATPVDEQGNIHQVAVDPSGRMPSGEEFDDLDGFKQILLKKKDQFAHALTGKVMTYALGRGMEYTDEVAINSIAEELAKNDYKMQDLIVAVITSKAFLNK